jgi:hypothetical protein
VVARLTDRIYSSASHPVIGNIHHDQSLPLVDFGEFSLFEGISPDNTFAHLNFTPGGRRERIQRKKRKRLQGWRFGVALSATTATTILLTNLALTVWASLRYPLSHGFGVVYEGDCNVVNSRGLWLHVLVNGLSSVLLSGSNYTMQCLTSPTRRECDIAHARGDWLDIGVSGVRNLTRISQQRRIFYFLLALSSIPVHLLYNAAVFKTLGVNSYTLVVANTGFLNETYAINQTYAINGTLHGNFSRESSTAIATVHEDLRNYSSSYGRLTPPECISIYEAVFLSSNSHVIAMTDHTESEKNISVFYTNTTSPLDENGSSW